MSRRVLLAFVVIAASLSLAACAGTTAATSPEARANHPSWLTGPWQANGWQVAGDTTQGRVNTVVTFAPDGTWKTPAGGCETSWLTGDLVYIEGKTRDNYAFQFSLKQRQISDGSRELFGVIDARAGTEQVSLKPIR